MSIRYADRLSEVGIEPSVGSVGDSYDNALAETINGLYKTEVIRRQSPWRNIEEVQFATRRLPGGACCRQVDTLRDVGAIRRADETRQATDPSDLILRNADKSKDLVDIAKYLDKDESERPLFALADPMNEEIDYLISSVGKGGCTFIRNGNKYSGKDARAQLKSKRRRNAYIIDSTEEFIE